MNRGRKIDVIENEDPLHSLEISNSPNGGDKHLDGLSADEKRMIRLMADIFVKNVLKLSEK